jgi:predicted HD superfamily hydrolase involved in NAD metabolism
LNLRWQGIDRLHPLLLELIKDFKKSRDLQKNVSTFLIHHESPKTAAHCIEVGEIARKLAIRFSVDDNAAQQAGWLHDISAVFPKSERMETSKALGIEILPEEEMVPLLLHQTLSVVLAKEIFGIEDTNILGAIGCHTTLKSQASTLDKVVFVADKLAWDQKGVPPYKEKLQKALEESLDQAAWVYQDYLWHSGKMKVIHPWMRESYSELSKKLEKN